jgi:hypothetical protein
MYIGLHVNYPLFSSDFNELGFSRQIFKKYSNIKFHENPSSGSRVVPCGQTDRTKLIVAFRNFANAPKKTVINFHMPAPLKKHTASFYGFPHHRHKQIEPTMVAVLPLQQKYRS